MLGVSCVNATEENPIMERDMGSRNIQKFISEINTIDWSCVTEIDDTQLASSEFHEIIIKKYNCCFAFKKQKMVDLIVDLGSPLHWNSLSRPKINYS